MKTTYKPKFQGFSYLCCGAARSKIKLWKANTKIQEMEDIELNKNHEKQQNPIVEDIETFLKLKLPPAKLLINYNNASWDRKPNIP